MNAKLEDAYRNLIEELKYTRTADLKSCEREAVSMVTNRDCAVSANAEEVSTFIHSGREFDIEGPEVALAQATLILVPEFIEDRKVQGDFDPYEFLGISPKPQISVDNEGPSPL